jgi:hypothetical protein
LYDQRQLRHPRRLDRRARLLKVRQIDAEGGAARGTAWIRKYAFVFALALAVICLYAPPSFKDAANLRRLDDISVLFNKSFGPAKPEVSVSTVDPAAADAVDEDLDFRIAQRIGSLEGWRSFLAAHPNGPHAQSARAEVDKLLPEEKHPAPSAAEVSNSGSSETKTPSEVPSPGSPSPAADVEMVASDEICRRDDERLERLSHSRSNDDAVRFLTELRCEMLRARPPNRTSGLRSSERRCYSSKSFFRGQSNKGCKVASVRTSY